MSLRKMESTGEREKIKLRRKSLEKDKIAKLACDNVYSDIFVHQF